MIYFIFTNLLAQEVRILSKSCFNSKWNFFHYEFSTFFDLFAKNNLQTEWRQKSNAIIFLYFFQKFSKFQAEKLVSGIKEAADKFTSYSMKIKAVWSDFSRIFNCFIEIVFWEIMQVFLGPLLGSFCCLSTPLLI